MQHFKIMVKGGGFLEGVYRDVAATDVDTAVKRVLSGAALEHRNGSPRQVGANRLKMAKGERISVDVERWS